MSLSAVAIASRALLRLGARPIQGFDDDTAESELAAALYAPTRDALLSAYGWSFATAQMQLPQLATPPLADYQNAFQLPNDFLRALSVGDGGRGRGVEYRLARRALHTNSSNIVLTYIFRPDESEWPPFFDTLLIARLSAELCLPLTENTSRTELLIKLADEEFRRTKAIDAQQDTPGRIEDFSLVGVRD